MMTPDTQYESALRLVDFRLTRKDESGEQSELFALDLIVQPGQILTVMGPSGSGKSSLIAAIGGFLAPAFSLQGRAFVGKEDITKLPSHKRCVGILFQDPLLFPHMSVGQNIMFGLQAGHGGQERKDQAEQLLVDLDLKGFFDRDPAMLSGGQQARVALARTLAANPRALLLDEPFSKLDQQLRQSVRKLVFDLSHEKGLPVLLVTHDEADANAANGPIVRL